MAAKITITGNQSSQYLVSNLICESQAAIFCTHFSSSTVITHHHSFPLLNITYKRPQFSVGKLLGKKKNTYGRFQKDKNSYLYMVVKAASSPTPKLVVEVFAPMTWNHGVGRVEFFISLRSRIKQENWWPRKTAKSVPIKQPDRGGVKLHRRRIALL